MSARPHAWGPGLLALVATYGIGRQAYGLFVPTFREEFGRSLVNAGSPVGLMVASGLVLVAGDRYGLPGSTWLQEAVQGLVRWEGFEPPTA